MRHQTQRLLVLFALGANVLFVLLAWLDYARWDTAYSWPIYLAWAVVLLLMVVLAFVSAGWTVEVHHDHPDEGRRGQSPLSPSARTTPSAQRLEGKP